MDDPTIFEGPRLSPERAWLVVAYAQIVELGDAALPRTITAEATESPQQDWRVVEAAFLARITRTASALAALIPIGSRLDGMVLARNLLEHVIAFAWIAADSDARFEVWLRSDYSRRLDHDKAARQRLASGVKARWTEEALSDEGRLAYREAVRRVKGTLPGIPRLAKEADAYWLPKYPAGPANHQTVSLVSLYDHVYDSYSWMSHPNLVGLQSFWDHTSRLTVVHGKEVGEKEHDPLHMGLLLYGVGLLVIALSTGNPRPDDVLDVLSRNADLALANREGRLAVDEVAPGRFRLDVR